METQTERKTVAVNGYYQMRNGKRVFIHGSVQSRPLHSAKRPRVMSNTSVPSGELAGERTPLQQMLSERD
jgi:hypothetical protein